MEDYIGCTECILSFNLRNKSYTIENVAYSKEEYFKKKAALGLETAAGQQRLWERFLELRGRRAVKYGHILNSERVSGDYLFNSKNCTNSFECVRSEDCREVITAFSVKDCFNCDYLGDKSELSYNNVSTLGGYRTAFSYFTLDSSDVEYSELTQSSHYIFGCIGMTRQSYCILNRRYGKEEFFELRAQIIEHMKGATCPRPRRAARAPTQEWGRFFPKALSTFPYNESTASFFFPRTKAAALAEGFSWQDETTESKEFKLVPQEIRFYDQQGIPYPTAHSDDRYRQRLALRNPFTLWSRACAECGAAFKTTYATDRPERVLCEGCYWKNI